MRNSSRARQKVVDHPSRTGLRRKKKFNLFKSKLPLLFLVLLLVYTLFSFGVSFRNLYAMQQDVRKMEEQVANLEKKNAELRKQLEMVASDAYVEEVAREKLGLIKAGETRIVPVSEPAPEGD